MKYSPIPPALFTENRKRFVKKLKPNSVAIFNSNDIMPSNSDAVMSFIQNSDLFYLSGVDQEDSTLVIFPDTYEEKHREILFLRETNDHIAIWEGQKLTKEKARECSGINTVYWQSEFHAVLKALMAEAEHVYLNSNEHIRATNVVESRDARFVKWFKKHYPLHHCDRIAPILHELRAIKMPAELELIKTAVDITEKAFRRVLKFIKPGVMEYEIEAELAHEFLRNRSRGSSYYPIVASGANACILHYVDNNKMCKDGDMLLMDFGAEYANYASDLTRCVPVNGKFTNRQKKVYNAVLHVMRQSEKLLTPGKLLRDYHREVGALMTEELLKLRLLKVSDVKKEKPETEETKKLYRKYFMHGTSHFLGLDVHDVGAWHKPVRAGMVFTCEPGIYIKEEGIGIRLENDILITEKGSVDLMANIPIEAEEIEQLMKSSTNNNSDSIPIYRK